MVHYFKNVGDVVKDIYTYLQSVALDAPFISLSEIIIFCKEIKIYDHNLKEANSTVDQAVANNVALGTIPKKKGFVRSEFFEFLVR